MSSTNAKDGVPTKQDYFKTVGGIDTNDGPVFKNIYLDIYY